MSKKEKLFPLSKKIVFSLFLILYIYSGAIVLMDAKTRNNKINILTKKFDQNEIISQILIIGASILELICPLVIIIALFTNTYKSNIVKVSFGFLLLFMIVVSLLYYYDRIIPLLTNLSLLAGLTYTCFDLYQ